MFYYLYTMKTIPILPIEIINKIFSYVSSNTAPLIKQYWRRKRINDFYDMITGVHGFIEEILLWDEYCLNNYIELY
jgi:hypothetical protein